MSGAEGNRPGRRAYVPADDDRAAVRRMAGMRHLDIAASLKISVPTLRKYFRAELNPESQAADLFAAPPSAAKPSRRAAPAGGRPAFQPHEGHRRQVMELAAVGKPAGQIARIIGISEPTLRKHFEPELATGAERVEAEVIRAMMSKARAGSVAAQREALAMIGQARLDRMESAISAAPAARPDTPGKKLAAQLEAAQIIETATWAEHLRPH